MDAFNADQLKMLDKALTLLAKDIFQNRHGYTADEKKAAQFLFGSVQGEIAWREVKETVWQEGQ